MRRGRRRPIVSRESSIGHAAAKRQRGSVVGRLLDMFDRMLAACPHRNTKLLCPGGRTCGLSGTRRCGRRWRPADRSVPKAML